MTRDERERRGQPPDTPFFFYPRRLRGGQETQWIPAPSGLSCPEANEVLIS
jgi:hypothetical protein